MSLHRTILGKVIPVKSGQVRKMSQSLKPKAPATVANRGQTLADALSHELANDGKLDATP
jgi:hypothetical protein